MTSAPIRSVVEADLFSYEFLADPYPTYARLRDHDPVHWDDRLSGWVVTRHSDVYAAHLDPQTYSSHRLGVMVSDRVGEEASDEMKLFMQIAPEWMLFRDPPDHTRIRRQLMSEFRVKDIRALRTQIEAIVSAQVDRILAMGEFDLVRDLCYELPGRVLAAQYGLAGDDGVMLTDWWYEIRNMQRVFLGADPLRVAPSGSPTATAFAEMTPYLTELIAERRRRPQDDLVTRVISFAEQANRDGERLGEHEMFAHLLLLPLASFGTTMDLMSNGLLGLLSQRDQWERLVREPAIAVQTVEEVLRFDASVQLTHRLVTRDVEIAGQPIAAGELVYLVRGAANRDPQRWTDPDRIDVTRRDSGHVGFGVGIHRCLGASLARAVTAATYRELAVRVPDLELDPARPHEWKADTPQFRGMTTLPARCGRRTR